MTGGRHHRVELGADGVAILTFDMAGKSANLLSTDSVLELTNTFLTLATRPGIEGLLLCSGKPKQFIAGANIEEIRSLTDPAEAAEKSRAGQGLMDTIEKLPFPTAALIDGPCLGGGLELAMACTYRVAGDEPHVRLALPEVRLGIIPGFGGTQRLPRIVGFLPAMEMIVSGRTVDGRRACVMGLVDDCSASPLLEEIARRLLARGKRSPRAAKLPVWQKLLERPGFGFLRDFLLNRARKRIVRSTSGFYPAPLAALEVLHETFGGRTVDGYEVEARKVGELIVSPVAKALIDLFLATEEIRRSRPSPPRGAAAKVGVIGAGVMGSGIAALLAAKGKAVRLRDVSVEILAAGLASIRRLEEKELGKKRITKWEFAARLARIAPTTGWTGLGRADVVIEAALEEMSVKKEIFAEISRRAPEHALLATNTSALSVTEIAAAVKNPSRVLGMHFFNPVHRMPLLEIVKAAQTSEEAVAAACDLAAALGKTPIVVADRPGFLVNRILCLYLNEACLAAEQGIDPALIDGAMKSFGMPMGPFELMDEVGLDVAAKVGRYLCDVLPHFPKASELPSAAVNEGRLGKKGKKGFYIHGRKGKPVLDRRYVSALLGRIDGRAEPSAGAADPLELTDRFVLLMVNEATRCLADGVVGSARDVDLGMVLGTGFAPFRGGLIGYARSRGKDEIAARLSDLARKYGSHFDPGDRVRFLGSDAPAPVPLGARQPEFPFR